MRQRKTEILKKPPQPPIPSPDDLEMSEELLNHTTRDFESGHQWDRDQAYGYEGYYYGGADDYETPTEEPQAGLYHGAGPKNFKRSDEMIKDDVCKMLTVDHDIDAHNIDVEVKNGEVLLTGSVPYRRMKYLAEDGAAKCLGVTDVHNQLRVGAVESKSH